MDEVRKRLLASLHKNSLSHMDMVNEKQFDALKEEVGQHEDQLKLQTNAISELRAEVKALKTSIGSLIELWEKLEICGFRTTLHSEPGNAARHRIGTLTAELRRKYPVGTAP
jgi:predicted  nucleic acid-binding Zn-ribbon protein